MESCMRIYLEPLLHEKSCLMPFLTKNNGLIPFPESQCASSSSARFPGQDCAYKHLLEFLHGRRPRFSSRWFLQGRFCFSKIPFRCNPSIHMKGDDVKAVRKASPQSCDAVLIVWNGSRRTKYRICLRRSSPMPNRLLIYTRSETILATFR